MSDPGTKLHEAIEFENIEMLRTAIAAGADLNRRYSNLNTALIESTRNGYTSGALVLIEAGAEVDAQNLHGNTALITAVYFGHTECMQKLIEAGGDLNFRNSDGNSALMIAFMRGEVCTMKTLLAAGASAPDLEWGCSVIDRKYSESTAGACFAVLIKELGIDASSALQRIRGLEGKAAQTARSILEARILGSFAKLNAANIQRAQHV